METRFPIPAADRLANHWWSRPGWEPGRLVDTWHLTFGHAGALHELVRRCQASLAGLPALNHVPVRWLHLTIQAVGWSDELTAPEIGRVVESVRAEVRELRPFALELGPPVVKGEGLVLPAQPAPVLGELRERLRAGVAAGLGRPAQVAAEQAAGFVPHVSVAYARGDADAAPYADALAAVVAPATASVHVEHVTLIRQDRLLAPEWLYRWEERARADLGS